MFGWRDFEVKLEQHQDRLRQAEAKRLVVEEKDKKEQASLWQVVSKIVSNKQAQSSAGDKAVVGR